MTKASSQSVSRRRSRGANIDTSSLGYVAMHEINAAMCIAGGVLGPRFEEGAVQDHHIDSGGLVIEAIRPSKNSLLRASGELGYGAVCIFEVIAPEWKSVVNLSLSLLNVKRLIFQSSDAELQFRARISGFGDIPENVVLIDVDAELFFALSELIHPKLFQDSALEPDLGPSVLGVGIKTMRSIDRCGGALLAAFASTKERLSGDDFRDIARLHLTLSDDSSPAYLATELALSIDGSSEAKAYALMFKSVADILCSGEMDSGFSGSELQRLAQPQSVKGLPENSKTLKIIDEAWKFTEEVLSLRREVPNGGWSDIGGSPLARGMLLFLLNPEPEQLQAAPIRVPNVGPRVLFVAGLLVGLRVGLARLGRELKEDTESFLGVSAFAHSWLAGQRVWFQHKRCWDSHEGSVLDTLEFKGNVLLSSKGLGNPELLRLASVLRSRGVNARFSKESGELSGSVSGDENLMCFEFKSASLPVFPLAIVRELSLTFDCKSSKRVIQKCLDLINLGTAEHRVSGKAMPEVRHSFIRLSVYLSKEAGDADHSEAVNALLNQVKQLFDVLQAEKKL